MDDRLLAVINNIEKEKKGEEGNKPNYFWQTDLFPFEQ